MAMHDFGLWARLRKEAIEKVCDRHTDQEWVREWITEPLNPNEVAIDWIKGLPRELHPHMIAFPPNSLVRAAAAGPRPAVDWIGIVTAWREDGSVIVRSNPSMDSVRDRCDPRLIELAICRMPVTPLWLQQLFAGGFN